jgi:hypothetical protein
LPLAGAKFLKNHVNYEIEMCKVQALWENEVRGKSHMKNVHGRLEDEDLVKKDMIFECCVFIGMP